MTYHIKYNSLAYKAILYIQYIMPMFCFRNRPVIQLMLVDFYDNIQTLFKPVSKSHTASEALKVDVMFPKTYNLRARKSVNYRV